MFKNQMIKSFLRVAGPCLLLAAAACVTKTNQTGYVKEAEITEAVIIGQSSRDDVREKLGSPSSQSTFGTETWYYISGHTEAVAFFTPDIVEQEVIRVEFNDSGIVSDVKKLSKKDGKEFDLVKRTTPTEGHSMGIMEQLLGNIGRFNRQEEAGTLDTRR
jgi:outer membrane protein assembly factor BamE (lipoprotein component of BamABCDE complex)